MAMKILYTVVFLWVLYAICGCYKVLGQEKYNRMPLVNKLWVSTVFISVSSLVVFAIGYIFVWIWR